MELNDENVKNLFFSCLYDENELPKDNSIPDSAIIVKGITKTVGFKPENIEKNRADIENLLENIHEHFKEGWTFLYFCYDVKGNNWTWSQNTMELLMLLGIAIKKVDYCFPREMWIDLPGSVPYIIIK